MAENRLSTITQFEDIVPTTDDVVLISHKAGNEYVSKKSKLEDLPFVNKNQYATKNDVGIIEVGDGLKVDTYGKVDVDYSNMPIATSEILGGIKVGANLQVAKDGTLSAGNSYVLPVATSESLGGVKIGAGIDIEDGTISVPVSGVTKIRAGSNIDISPVAGTGEVTISTNDRGGDAGVIDGTCYDVPGSKDLICNVTTMFSNVYTAHHDCYLVAKCKSQIASNLTFAINGNPIAAIPLPISFADADDYAFGTPVKGGVIVQCKCAADSQQIVLDFYEYKLVEAIEIETGYVSKIIAGDNVTISPVEGTGQVKISSTGGGGVISSTGGGGVIDGTILHGPTIKTMGDVAALPDYTYEYIVNNDCFLYIHVKTDFNSSSIHEYIDVYLNNTKFDTIKESESNSETEYALLQIPIKKGTVVKFVYSAKPDHTASEFLLNITEYKLHSLAPQIAMPDYKATPIPVTNSWTATENGWIVCKYEDSTEGTNAFVKLFIESKEVWSASWELGYGDNNCQTSVVPISKNEKVTWIGDVDNRVSVDFYPCKSVQQSHPTDCVSYVVETGRFYSGTGQSAVEGQTNDSWYRLYSDGWCEQGGIVPDNDAVYNLFKHYADDSYTIVATPNVLNNTTCGGTRFLVKTTNTFKISLGDDSGVQPANIRISWRAEGFVS